MIRGPLHNRGADGFCDACGERFPCPTGIAIYEAVKRELERSASLPEPVGFELPSNGGRASRAVRGGIYSAIDWRNSLLLVIGGRLCRSRRAWMCQ
jgi:hypothetical protein